MSAAAAVEREYAYSEHGAPFTVEHFEPWAYDLELDTGDPWRVEPYFLDFLADYFAGIPELWLIVPEGNAKTTNLGGLADYLLEFRPCAAIPWAASSREQAEIGYTQAAGFARRSPRLRGFLKCQDGYRRIKNLHTGGLLQVKAADDATGDGIIPTDAFLDELHRQKNLRLYRTWRGKLAKRGGQMATISTAGEPGGEFEETRELIRQTVPVVAKRPGYTHCRSEQIALHDYAVADGADVEDMAVVKTANPASFITEESLARKRATPTMSIEHWRRFTCDLATRSGRAAIAEADWFARDASVGKNDPLHQSIPAGEPVDVGFDAGWKWDTTALVPFWMPEPTFRLFGPATVLEPPRDGTMLDGDKVRRAFVEIHDVNPIQTVVMDMSRAEQIAQWLESELGVTVIDRSQGNAAAVEDYDRFMEALREGWLWHSGDRALTRHALNAIARVLPLGDARFDRPSSTRQGGDQDRRVIDALSAGSMVHSVMAAGAGETAKPWVAVW